MCMCGVEGVGHRDLHSPEVGEWDIETYMV